LKRFKGELFNALVEIIPNFCSRKTGVEFSIVCVEGIDIVILGRSKLLVLVLGGGGGGGGGVGGEGGGGGGENI